ncbi:MAG: P-II family nitrogen regulator [Planctomycetaceae bacterium]|nr:P-II family nitrogen regulator [Planctomycetaceae bacterium]
MKLVLAVIKPTKLDAVREALEKIEVARLTVCDAQAFDEQKLPDAACHDGPQSDSRQLDLFPFAPSSLLQKVVFEIVVNDDFLDRTVQTIATAACIGPAGSGDDGKIFILPADQAIKIDTASRGPGAV